LLLHHALSTLSTPLPPCPTPFPYTTLFRSRRHEPPPDQLVQLELLRVEMLLQVVGAPQHIGRPDRLVRVLDAHEAIRPTDVLRRSEEHTSELQSRGHLVCRLLLEKKKKT